MSATTWLAVAALVVACVAAGGLGIALVRTRARLERVERLVGALDGELHHDVRAALEQARDEARAAGREARRARHAPPECPRPRPRLPVRARDRAAGPHRGAGRGDTPRCVAPRRASRAKPPVVERMPAERRRSA